MKTSEKTDKIYAKLFEVKKELQAVTKSSDNPFFKSKYADLNTYLDAVEPLFEKFGLLLLQPQNTNSSVVSILQSNTTVSANDSVESRIIDVESQQWVSSEMSLIVAKNTMQDAGSAVTYARRYTLGALLGMKAEDDDGERAMVRSTSVKYSTPPTKTLTTASAVAPAITEPAAQSKPLEPFKGTSSFSKKKKEQPLVNNTTPVENSKDALAW